MDTGFWVGVWLVSVGLCAWVGFKDGDLFRGVGAGVLFGPLGFLLLLWLIQTDGPYKRDD
jgi:hypothetical protein